MADNQQAKSATVSKNEQKKQEKLVSDFMAAGLDLTPFTIDTGDGTIWEFTPDPMPADTERLSKAMTNLQAAITEREGSAKAGEELIEAIRDRLLDDEQKKLFPKPGYGQNALLWFALHLATGRSGFPTEQD